MRWTYQYIRTCITVSLMSRTHTEFTRRAKSQLQVENSAEIRHKSYSLPNMANRVLTTLKCECSAHYWWNPGLYLLLHRALCLCRMRLFQKDSNKWLCRNIDIFVTQGFLSANGCRLNWLSVHSAAHFLNDVLSQTLRLI